MARSNKKMIESKAFDAARQLEKDGHVDEAMVDYEKLMRKNPLHLDATTRLLVLYRKQGLLDHELKLLKSILKAHRLHHQEKEAEWLQNHKKLAEDSKPLAKILGLLNKKDMPFREHETLQQWEVRLERLEQRMKRAAEVRQKLVARKRKK